MSKIKNVTGNKEFIKNSKVKIYKMPICFKNVTVLKCKMCTKMAF